MDFRTYIDIPKSEFKINHRQKIMLFGSCFAENIGKKLSDNKLDVLINPFGILYNPLSISKAMRRLIHKQVFTEEDLVFHNQIYQSFMHQGKFSNASKDACLAAISESFDAAADRILQTDLFLITFGTSFVFKLKSDNEVVGNCHKFPPAYFERERLSVDSIVSDWTQLLQTVLTANPQAKFIFTVSPNRHLKDGAHQNQISKATLMLAIEQLQTIFGDVVDYFCAYEILLDELRDYRFYAPDMIHPSETAVDYIWQRFAETYFTGQTKNFIQDWSPIKKAIEHKPLGGETANYVHFLQQTWQKVLQIEKKYPEINFGQEKNNLLEKINLSHS